MLKNSERKTPFHKEEIQDTRGRWREGGVGLWDPRRQPRLREFTNTRS